MTTSGSIDFSLVTNTLIDEAFDLCGVGSEGEAISADMYARAKRSLNLIVKHKGAKGHLYTKTERSVTLLASTASYALTPKPLRVLEVRRRLTADSYDTRLDEWSRDEYLSQTDKTSDSVPVAFYYDPQTVTGTLYVWPRPSTATAADMTLQLTYLRKIEDFDSSADEPDLPQECLLSLAYDLAEQLALKYDVRKEKRNEIAQRAAAYRIDIESWDVEPTSLFLQPVFG